MTQMTQEQTPERPEEEAGTESVGNDNETKPVSDIRILEAMLFASAEPLTTNNIRERLGENADVGGLLMELKETYAERGVELVEMDGSWAFRTADDLGDALKMKKEVQRKLSRAAMETLAIVAYHQPVTRAEIENIRGVATHKGTLDVLMECGWVKPGRRRETPGRPLTWGTTTTFMDHFGLESMNELPGLDELKASGLLDRRPAIDTVPGTGELFDEEGDLEEGGADEDGYEREFEADEETPVKAAEKEPEEASEEASSEAASEDEIDEDIIEDIVAEEDDLDEEIVTAEFEDSFDEDDFEDDDEKEEEE